jgi:hypothetical protein
MEKDVDNTVTLLRANPEALFLPGAMLMKYGPENYVGGAFSVRGTLYFDGSHTAEVRSRICTCFESYESIAKDHLTWLWRDEPPSGPDLLAYGKTKPMRSMVESLRPNDVVAFAYTGGKKPEDASPWTFQVSGLREWEAKMGTWGLATLTFSFPALFVEENPLVFQNLFVEFAKNIKAVHGFGGFSFNLSLVRREPNEASEALMASKMNGIDVGNPVIIGGRVKYGILDKIKTVGWLTAINHKMIEEVGGLATLSSELPLNWFAKYDYGSGIVIQSGPKPEIVPVELDPRPAIYVLPNMALKDIRMTEIGGFHYGSKDGEPRLVGWAADQWLKRFDIEYGELLNYKTKLLDEPKLTIATALPDRL